MGYREQKLENADSMTCFDVLSGEADVAATFPDFREKGLT